MFVQSIKGIVKSFIRKITGISTPFVGLSWEVVQSEKEIARDLNVYLTNKRVLHKNHGRLHKEHTCLSLIDLRKYLNKTLLKLDESSVFFEIVKGLQYLCVEYQNYLEESELDVLNTEFIFASSMFRKEFLIMISSIFSRFDIEIAEELL